MLYRLRWLSEQTPLDSPTFSYLFPLLRQVLLKGGIGLSEEDDPLEQVALALDIIKFHCGECKCPVGNIMYMPLLIEDFLQFRTRTSPGQRSWKVLYLLCAIS